MYRTPTVGVGPGGRLEDRAAHRGVPARLVHQQLADVVQVLDEVAAPVEHRGAGDDADAARDHPGGHALGVRVDGVEDPRRAHRPAPDGDGGALGRQPGLDRGERVPPDDRLLLGRERHARRAARAAVPADEVHRQLDRLDELGLGVPAQERVELRGRAAARSSRSPRRGRVHSATHAAGTRSGSPTTQPGAPAIASSSTTSSEPHRTSSPGASSSIWYGAADVAA